LEPAKAKKVFQRSLRTILGARKSEKSPPTVTKKGPWSPQKRKKPSNGHQERSLEPAKAKKARQRSPRKILGARNSKKGPPTVTKKGPWSPQKRKKHTNGHQERFLEPAKAKKAVRRSPRKVLGARKSEKSPPTVTKNSVGSKNEMIYLKWA
jgi:hypothetical protein